jgi:hypothetical protein
MKQILHSFQNWTRTHPKMENYRPDSIMDAKILNKTMAN